jgi:3-methyladenine DNA glycosylase AlkC
MQSDFTDEEKVSARTIVALLVGGQAAQGLEQLRSLKDRLYAAIPDRQRQSRGIVWVLQRITRLLVSECDSPERVRAVADCLQRSLSPDDRLIGIPIFLMAEYGKTDPSTALEFLGQAADSPAWEVREFAASGVRGLVGPCRAIVLPWLRSAAQSDSPRLRRMVSESLRPVTDNQWLNDEPGTSLDILRLLFREADPYPRTSVGNNLSDLARRNPELILEVVKELVASGDENSYRIAHRACRNLVKRNPERIMDLLHVEEYHYKDRHFRRKP